MRNNKIFAFFIILLPTSICSMRFNFSDDYTTWCIQETARAAITLEQKDFSTVPILEQSYQQRESAVAVTQQFIVSEDWGNKAINREIRDNQRAIKVVKETPEPTNTEENTRLCLACGMNFGTRGGLCTHIRYIHKNLCWHCWESFNNKEELKAHISMCSKKHIFICNICHTFQTRSQYFLNNHKKKCNPEKRKEFPCKEPGCTQYFSSFRALVAHILQYHIQNTSNTALQQKNLIPCIHIQSGCNKTFKNISSLIIHIRAIHEEQYKCPYCNRLCHSAKALRDHKERCVYNV